MLFQKKMGSLDVRDDFIERVRDENKFTRKQALKQEYMKAIVKSARVRTIIKLLS